MKPYIPIVSLLLISSCGALHRVPQKEYIHDTLTVYKNNTIHERDSIYFWRDRFIYTKGDTVYNETTVYKDRWREKEIHDTLFKDRAVYVDKEVPVMIEKELTKIQKLLLIFGKIFIGLILIASGYFVVKKFVLKI